MAAKSNSPWNIENSFDSLKRELMKIDPVCFAESYLNLDGKPFKITGNGWKWIADIYRHIITAAMAEDAKPVVMVKARQVAGTTLAAALELYMMSSGMYGVNGVPPIRVMHLFPQLELMHSFSKDKLEKMINESIPIMDNSDGKSGGKARPYVAAQKDSSRDATDSLTYKKFKNGNTLWCESIGSEGTRILGRTCDILYFDEVQDMSEVAIGKATKCATRAQFGPQPGGVQIYFGTPRQKGTFFHRMWEESDQRRYYLGCQGCKNYFLLYTPESSRWETEIWLYENVVKCPSCGEEQDKIEALERGKWIPTPGKENAPYVGFHFNQLFIPEFTKDKILKEKPDVNPINSEIIYNNEVLGEFHSGQGMPITFEEIYNNCRDSDRQMAKFIPMGEKTSYLGVDWGGKPDDGNSKRGKSFSCGVILTVDHQSRFVIEYAEKLKNNSWEGKIDFVENMFRTFSIRSAMGDIGHAEDLSAELKRQHGEKYKTVRSAGTVLGGVKYNKDELEIAIDRDKAIEEIFTLLRRGQIRFPWASYEKIIWLVHQCCSMESKITDRRGEAYTTYVKGKLQNDGLMALIYAYFAYKFDKTKGFKLSPHMVEKSMLPKPVLAYCKKKI